MDGESLKTIPVSPQKSGYPLVGYPPAASIVGLVGIVERGFSFR